MIPISNKGLDIYKTEMKDALRLSFPRLFDADIDAAIDYSIAKRFSDTPVKLDNNYTHNQQDTTLYNVLNYIIEREPIVTVSGVLFKKHGTCPNPYVDLIQEFLTKRAEYKGMMLKYPKGSEMYEKYNLLQLSEKVSANAIYGASGNHTSIFYNVNVASSITMQGQNCIATALLLFEATLNNNVKFGSLNEIVQFINNVRRERPTRKYNDYDVIDLPVSAYDVFCQLICTCGFYYRPSEKDLMIVWDIINQLDQEDLNRIFFKNNLFYFFDNKYVMDKVVYFLSLLPIHFMDPNKTPNAKDIYDALKDTDNPITEEEASHLADQIKAALDDVYELVKEYVYYGHQYMDRLDRAENMVRSVSILTDTDSCFISFDGWYRYLLNKTYDIPMRIKEIEQNNEGKVWRADVHSYDYDFFKDEVIDLQQTLSDDNSVGPTAGYRCSLINVLAHIMGRLSIDYMTRYSTNSNAIKTADGKIRKSFFILKNEFQLKQALVTMVKKNYCCYQERQENAFIPLEEALDVKGMPIRKVGIPEKTARRIEEILWYFVLNAEQISQIDIIKQLAALEKMIYDSLMAGDKSYFKPQRIKASSGYADPMGQYTIKAAVAYNLLRRDNEPIIDLTTRNTVLIIKTDMTEKNIDQIKDTFPDVYERAVKMLASKDFKGECGNIAILSEEDVPEWVKPFINYTQVINDNIATFPVEALGIDRREKKSVNFTNIVSL